MLSVPHLISLNLFLILYYIYLFTYLSVWGEKGYVHTMVRYGGQGTAKKTFHHVEPGDQTRVCETWWQASLSTELSCRSL